MFSFKKYTIMQYYTQACAHILLNVSLYFVAQNKHNFVIGSATILYGFSKVYRTVG